jgi:hypothetical protein
MSDTPMPETLQTIAAKITALGKSMDERFERVDRQFADVKAQLGVKIEAVDAKVDLVYDVLIAQQQYAGANALAHDEFRERLDNHDVRILALEPPKSADR